MENARREKMRDGESQKKEDADEVAKHRVFPMFCRSGRSKSKPAEATGAEPAGQPR